MDHFVTSRARDSDIPDLTYAPNISHATTAADLAAMGKRKRGKTRKYSENYLKFRFTFEVRR